MPGRPDRIVAPRGGDMRSLLILGVFGAYLALGLGAPFVLGLGYVWVDLYSPQNVAYSVIKAIPVSMVMGAATFAMYWLTDRRYPPRPTLLAVLLILFAGWVTLTTTWAVAPDLAWFKWNIAVKTLLFAVFMPFLFRSRIQLEALILTMLFALSGNMISFGLKTVLTGGGYGRQLGLTHDLGGIAESSGVAMLGAAIIPLILFLKRHSLIVPRFKHTAFAYNGIALVSVFTALGTFARTGLVALGVLGLMLWVQSRRKALVGFGMMAGGLLGFLFMSDRWAERMATIRNPTADTSAGGRLEVWKWTLEFVASHPFGGGFDAYVVNSYVQQMPDGTEVQGVSRAFHSIYFQLLGEHGYVGLAIFAMMILTMFLNMADIRRRTRGVRELDWLHDLMKALMMTTVVYLCGGAFIGIAFQPPLYEFMAIVIAAKQYCRRAAPIVASGPSLATRLSAAPPLPYAPHAARSSATRIARES